MVWCNACRKNVRGERPYDGALACDLCGRELEEFNFSTEVTFVKNAAGQSQASGKIVNTVQSGTSISRERRIRIARDEFMNLRDALEIGDGTDYLINIAVKFFTMAVEQNFTRGCRTELVQSSCLYLTCRDKEIPVLLIDFSSYLRVSVYELGHVYLKLCELFYLVEKKNYAKLVDPSVFIPRFSNKLLKGTHNKAVVKTAIDIIASMKRDWMQTGRKPSGICGAALYIAALSHGIKCSKTDIVKIVHICEGTLMKRLIEFGNTEAASLNVDELSERETVKRSFTMKATRSDKERVLCMHQDCKPFGYGLCESYHNEFINVCGGLVGGSDPPAFQQAEKERMQKEENEGGIGSLNHDDQASDESGNISDTEVDWVFFNEDEKREAKIAWELLNPGYVEEADKKVASEASNASNANCPEYARMLVQDSKAAVANSRKEKRRKRDDEAKNLPPPDTAMEAVRRTLDKKNLSKLINYDILAELFDTSPVEKSPKKSKTETDNDEEISVLSYEIE